MDETPDLSALRPVIGIVYSYLNDRDLPDDQPSALGQVRTAIELSAEETKPIQDQDRRVIAMEAAWQQCVESLERDSLYDFWDMVAGKQDADRALPTKLELRVSATDNKSHARINKWLGLWREDICEERHLTARTRLLRHLQHITVAGLIKEEPNDEEEHDDEEEPVELKEQLVELPISFLKHQDSAHSLVLQNVRLVQDCAGAVSLYAPYCTRIYWQNVRTYDDTTSLNLGARRKRLRHWVQLEDVRVNNIYLGHPAAETKAVLNRVQADDLDAIQLQTLDAKDCDFGDVSLLLRHTEKYGQKNVTIDNCRLTACRLSAPDRAGRLDIKGCQVETITLATILGRTFISDCSPPRTGLLDQRVLVLNLEPLRTDLLAQRVELSIVNCTALSSLWVPEFHGHLYLKGCDSLRALRTGRETDQPQVRRGLPDDDANLDKRLTSTVWHVTDSAGSLAVIDGPYRGGHSPVLLEIGADVAVDIPLQRCVLDISGFLWVSVGPHTSRVIRWHPRPLRLETYALYNDANRPTLAVPAWVQQTTAGTAIDEEWPSAGRHALEAWWSGCAQLLLNNNGVSEKFKFAAFYLQYLQDNLHTSGAEVVRKLREQPGYSKQILESRRWADVPPDHVVQDYALKLWQTLNELREMQEQVAAYAVKLLDRKFRQREEKKEARKVYERFACVVKCLQPEGPDNPYSWLGTALGNCLGSETSLVGLSGTIVAAVDELCLAAFTFENEQILRLLSVEIPRFCNTPHAIRKLLSDGRALLKHMFRLDFPVPDGLLRWDSSVATDRARPDNGVRYLVQHVLFRLRDTHEFRLRNTETAQAVKLWLNGCKPRNVAWPKTTATDKITDFFEVVEFLSSSRPKERLYRARAPEPAPEPAPEAAPLAGEEDIFDSPPHPAPVAVRPPPGRPTKPPRSARSLHF